MGLTDYLIISVQIDKLQMDFVKWKNESESYDRWVQRENTLRDRNIREATRVYSNKMGIFN